MIGANCLGPLVPLVLLVLLVPLCGLTWSWLAGFRDADPVIGEFRVHAWKLYFRHVTRRAFRCAHRTRGRTASLGFGFFRGGEMARETLAIVVGSVFL